jgi:CheY-like chemotaxis protein
MVSEMDRMLRRTLGENIEIKLVRGDQLWQAFFDRAQLESALLNLCINARDAMPEGGMLTIETANVHIEADYAERNPGAVPGPHVLLAVSDSGEGIRSDVLPRIFEPFFTTKGNGRGTGLGLSMVYGFIKQSRGHIKVYSELGEGTTFRIYLPKALDPSEVVIQQPPNDEVCKGSERILAVEDDAMVRRFATDQLRLLGYQVIEATDGPSALAILRSDEPVDLLFTDVVMPGGMNGRQLADAAVEVRPGLKVLYTSGYTSNAILHNGRLSPGAHLLNKPYGRRELASKIREALDAVSAPPGEA